MVNFGTRCQYRSSALTMHSFGGPWTQEKLEILRRYLDAYTTALRNQPFSLIYVDAFAGSGNWRPRKSDSEDQAGEYDDFAEMHLGSSAIALGIDDRPFDRLVFVEENPEYVASLRSLGEVNQHRHIEIIDEDANQALPRICEQLRDSDRAVVFLDPYATETSWSTIEKIAETQKIDCWILFPLMAITRLLSVDQVPDDPLAPILDRVFGGREHWEEFYSTAPQQTCWSQGLAQQRERGSQQIADKYRQRLETTFARVAPTRRVLRNTRNSQLFDLFFAASNPVGAPVAIRIADHILRNW